MLLLDKFRNTDGSFKWSTLTAVAGNAFFALAVMYVVCLIAHPAFEKPETSIVLSHIPSIFAGETCSLP